MQWCRDATEQYCSALCHTRALDMPSKLKTALNVGPEIEQSSNSSRRDSTGKLRWRRNAHECTGARPNENFVEGYLEPLDLIAHQTPVIATDPAPGATTGVRASRGRFPASECDVG